MVRRSTSTPPGHESTTVNVTVSTELTWLFQCGSGTYSNDDNAALMSVMLPTRRKVRSVTFSWPVSRRAKYGLLTI